MPARNGDPAEKAREQDGRIGPAPCQASRSPQAPPGSRPVPCGRYSRQSAPVGTDAPKRSKGSIGMPDFDDLPLEERLAALGRLANAALARYDLPDGAAATLINVSENATYRVDAPGSRRRDGRCGCTERSYHSRNGIASELAWLSALRRDGAVITPDPHRGPGRSAHPAHLITPICRGHGTWCSRAGRRARSPTKTQDDLRAPFEILGEITARMHLHVRNWEEAGRLRALHLGLRDHARGQAALGILARRHGPHPGDRGALPHGPSERIGERLERFGKVTGTLQPRALRHAAGQPVDRRRDDQGHRLRRPAAFSYLMYDCATTVSFFEHRPEVPEPHRGLGARLPQGGRAAGGGRSGDPHVRDAAPTAPRRLGSAPTSETDLAQSQGGAVHAGTRWDSASAIWPTSADPRSTGARGNPRDGRTAMPGHARARNLSRFSSTWQRRNSAPRTRFRPSRTHGPRAMIEGPECEPALDSP